MPPREELPPLFCPRCPAGGRSTRAWAPTRGSQKPRGFLEVLRAAARSYISHETANVVTAPWLGNRGYKLLPKSPRARVVCCYNRVIFHILSTRSRIVLHYSHPHNNNDMPDSESAVLVDLVSLSRLIETH